MLIPRRPAEDAEAAGSATAGQLSDERLGGIDPYMGTILTHRGPTLIAMRVGPSCATGRVDLSLPVRHALLLGGIIVLPFGARLREGGHRNRR